MLWDPEIERDKVRKAALKKLLALLLGIIAITILLTIINNTTEKL